jgi:hypothetical protein
MGPARYLARPPSLDMSLGRLPAVFTSMRIAAVIFAAREDGLLRGQVYTALCAAHHVFPLRGCLVAEILAFARLVSILLLAIRTQQPEDTQA